MITRVCVILSRYRFLSEEEGGREVSAAPKLRHAPDSRDSVLRCVQYRIRTRRAHHLDSTEAQTSTGPWKWVLRVMAPTHPCPPRQSQAHPSHAHPKPRALRQLDLGTPTTTRERLTLQVLVFLAGDARRRAVRLCACFARAARCPLREEGILGMGMSCGEGGERQGEKEI